MVGFTKALILVKHGKLFNGFPNKQGYYTDGSTAKGLVTIAYLEFFTDSLNGIYMGNRYNTVIDGLNISYTSDGGQTWQNTQTNINNCLASGLYWKNKDSVFLCAFNQNTYQMYVYLSKDKGKTWQITNGILSTNASDCQIYFPTPSHGYAFSSYYYGETIDGGNTWTPVTYNAKIIQTMLKFKNGQVLICADDTPKTVFPNCKFSSIPNSSGTKIGSNQLADLGYGKVYSASGYSVTEQKLEYSSDSGKTWKSQVIAKKSYTGDNDLYGVAFLNSKIGIAVGTYLSSYVTTNGGTTWQKYVHGGAEGFKKIYCKTKDKCFITGNAGRLFRTNDGGLTWNYRDLYSTTLQNVVFPTTDTGYVSASGVIFRTIDGGNNWTKFIQPDDGSFLSFPTKDTGYVGYSSGWVNKTVDAGQTWNPAIDVTYLNNIGYGGGGACFRSTSEGLVSGPDNLLYTNDGGDSWKSITLSLSGYAANSIIDLNGRDWIVMGGNGQVYKCNKNLNCSLKYFNNPNNYTYYSGYKQDTNNIYLVTINDTLVVTHDGGNTWKKTKDSLFGKVTFPTLYSNVCYSAFGTYVYKGVFKSQTISKQFAKIDNQTLTCTITNDANENYNASILLITNTLDTIALSANTVITSGISVSIKIPNTIQANTYTILIQPTDTAAFSVVQSQSFTLTGISITETEKPLIVKVVGNRIVCDCLNLEIYNTVGQRMQNNSELPNGIYIVKCNNVSQKIIKS